MKIVIQARMSSQRLPGKSMLTLDGVPLLGHLLNRVSSRFSIDSIVVATSNHQEDDCIASYCSSYGVDSFRGSKSNVLERFHRALTTFGGDPVVRIGADCPLMDPDVIQQAVNLYEEGNGRWDYVSNTQERTYPRGLDVEVFSRAAIEKAYAEASLPVEKEHVTPYIYFHPELFTIHHLKRSPPMDHYRWTVDTLEDFQLVQHVYAKIGGEYSYHTVLELFQRYPHWININSAIQQNLVSK
jgi:spore coat polysaccharide biosynthesis protein SpsF